jgi:hypothetical protein
MTDALFNALMELSPIPPGTTDGVDGWLTSNEEAALLALGRYASGPVLEVGPWLGRSTACIAAGISQREQVVAFTTVELNPTVEQWTEIDGLWHFIPDPNMPSLGGSSRDEWLAIEAVVSHPLGVVGQLRQNLDRLGVAALVDVVIGDFRQVPLTPPYQTVFSDTLHNPDEIDRYALKFRALLEDGGVFACHDMTPQNRESLGRVMTFDQETQIDGLFVGRVS